MSDIKQEIHEAVCEFAREHKICVQDEESNYRWPWPSSHYFQPLVDLNAMNEAEKCIPEDLQYLYANYIEDMLDWDHGPDGECNTKHWLLLHLAAAQRAEAFCRTLRIGPFKEQSK